jgi:predicted amidohydrolase
MISQSEEENKKTIKALLCQLSPFHKDKEKNVERMSISLEKYSKDDHIDIVCFPELAFVGFNFENQKDAEPYAVEQG